MRTYWLLFALLYPVASVAQMPSGDALSGSLRTLNKFLLGCRESYTQVSTGERHPLLQAIVGKENYEKDLTSLRYAEDITGALAAHPDKVTGKLLVAVISTTDDFSVGVGSTRTEVMRRMVLSKNLQELPRYSLVAEELNSCQKNLFNASDGFVDLVMRYVGAEDEVFQRQSHSTH